jgi:putative membrane protein
MAAERTLLAWIRTALAMMGFGFVVARFGLFLREMSGLGGRNRGSGYGFSLPIGLALIVLGVGVSLLAAHQHFRLLRALRAGHVDIPISFVGIAVAVILGAIGLSMCVYIVAVSS